MQDICSPAMQTRKRREDDTKRIENVTAKIWVFPYDTGTQKPSIKGTSNQKSMLDFLSTCFKTSNKMIKAKYLFCI